METEPQTLDIIAGSAAAICALLSLLLWVRKWRFGGNGAPDGSLQVKPWSQSWIDFALILWGCVMFYAVFLFLATRYLLPDGYLDQPIDLESIEPTWSVLLANSLIQLAILLVVLGAKYYYSIKYFPTSSLWKDIEVGFDRLLRFLPLIWVASFVSLLVTQAVGIDSGEQEVVSIFQSIENPAKFIAMALMATIVAPILEEILFRGLILRFLLGKLGRIAALIVSSVLFSALHFNVDSFLPIAVLGGLLGKVYLDTGNLRVSVIMHVFFNLQTVLILALHKLLF